MTIVAREFDGAARGFAATSRAVLLERDLRNAGTMDGLFLERAHRIVIACGDDSMTLELAQMISDQYLRRSKAWRDRLPEFLYFLLPPDREPEEVVHAHFASTEMHQRLQQSRDPGLRRQRRFGMFSIHEETARYLFARARLVEKARCVGQKRLHVVVVGAGDPGLAITREALQHGCSAGLEPPLVTVVDRDTDATEGRFHAAIAHLFDHTIPVEDRPEIRFVPCKAEEMQTETLRNMDPVTAWVICCPEEAMNLALAMQLETAMYQGQIAPSPIYARQWQGSVHSDHKVCLGQADPLHLVAPFGGMPDVVPTLALLDPQLLELAKGINAEYSVTYELMQGDSPFAELLKTHGPPPWDSDGGPQDPDLREKLEIAFELDRQRILGKWNGLSQENKLANLAPARQAALRLWELGFEWKGRHAGVLPMVQKQYILRKVDFAAIRDPKTNAALLPVAGAEHRRWMIERALRGWSSAEAPKRSNPLRLHPNFQTFCALPAEESRHGKDLREFNVSTLRGILVTLSQNGCEVVARLPDEAAPVSLVQDSEIKAEGRLTLILPQDAEAAALARGVAQVVKWMTRERSCSIRLLPETPTAHVELKKPARDQLLILHEAALASGVHIWLQLPDARDLRRAIAKPAPDPETPETTVD